MLGIPANILVPLDLSHAELRSQLPATSPGALEIQWLSMCLSATGRHTNKVSTD